MDDLIKAALIGVGGTIVLDIWALFLTRTFQIPGMNWSMVGRWIGTMPQGQFAHASMAAVKPVAGETTIGWAAHYLIGMAYGLILLAIWGSPWIARPTILPPLLVSWTLLVAPYFIMMPGMGSGVAGSKTPKPNVARLKSLVGHSVFGIGMFWTALLLSRL
ncbi:DUF2938 domain-containing protein [Sphingobium lactosutens]|uniref:DUF2938 domain-containing protein n=1 Tax=Sphingobium lactosutens TaxID=522773 RepID=UPI0015C0F685|nr:DUF2938 domain-containing protein [Sphingobium lactosutens]NWK99174.1 DUF2938 domain-containing protein [Sphingobium lactosutens]